MWNGVTDPMEVARLDKSPATQRKWFLKKSQDGVPVKYLQGVKFMPNYIIAYHGGKKPASPEAGAAHMEKWKAWVAGLGDAAVNPGTPLMGTRIVSSDGVSDDGGPHSMSGYSIVKADDMEGALEMAKCCPFLETGGTLEVAEQMEMS